MRAFMHYIFGNRTLSTMPRRLLRHEGSMWSQTTTQYHSVTILGTSGWASFRNFLSTYNVYSAHFKRTSLSNIFPWENQVVSHEQAIYRCGRHNQTTPVSHMLSPTYISENISRLIEQTENEPNEIE